MSSDASFRCPVCRAAQELQTPCRRCQADLTLVVKARRRLKYLQQRLIEAAQSGDRLERERLATQVRWLAPRR